MFTAAKPTQRARENREHHHQGLIQVASRLATVNLCLVVVNFRKIFAVSVFGVLAGLGLDVLGFFNQNRMIYNQFWLHL